MNISRSGYYKWLKTKDVLNQYEINHRDALQDMLNSKMKRGYKSQYHNHSD